MEPLYLQVVMFTIMCSGYFFLALSERYYSSDVRRKESYQLSNFYLFNGGFFFIMILFLTSLIFYEEVYRYIPEFFLNFLPMVIVIFVVAYLVLTSHFISTRKVKIIKKVKLADEIYLDCSGSLNLSDLFLNRYKFTAKMLKKYGKEKTAGFYFLFGLILFMLSLFMMHYFVSIDMLCLYIFIIILFLILSLYGHKKQKERLGKAIQLASEWHQDDMN